MPVKPRTAALAGVAVVTVGALLVLMLRVSRTRDHELSPEARAEAAARHRQLGLPAPRAGAAARARGLRSQPDTRRFGRAARDPDKSPESAPEPAPDHLRTFSKPDDEDTVGKTPAGMGVVQRLTAMRARAGDAKLAPGVTRDEGIRVRMTEAQALFDDKRYDEALVMATSVLETAPKNIRMLRLAVSASCLGGDLDTARELLERLPAGDQPRMRKKCAEYGAEL